MISDPVASLPAAYEKAAPDFVRLAHRVVYEPLARLLVDALKPFVPVDRCRILDVAAGAGAFGARFGDVVAVDLSSAMLATNPALRRVRADGCALPLRTRSFEVAASTFGVNHVARPDGFVAEMARVAPVIGLTTWLRPEPSFAPKQIVNDELIAQVGAHRSDAGLVVDELSDAVGTPDVIARLLSAAGMQPHVTVAEVTVPWPGVDDYVAYRLSMPSTATPSDPAGLLAAVTRRIEYLDSSALVWRVAVIVGVGVLVAER